MSLSIQSQDLSGFNTLGLQSMAAAVVRYQSVDQLPRLSDLAVAGGGRFVLGGGSNVVLSAHIKPLIIKVESRGIALQDQDESAWIVEAQAGETWHDFVDHCLAQGWNGLENLALIPGTVGAAPVQNIGAYGVELDQRFHSLLAWDFAERKLCEMGLTDCGFSYRDSVFKQSAPGRWLIVSVRFRLPKQWRPVLQYPDLARYESLSGAQGNPSARQVFEAVCEIRRNKLPDPVALGNAGSFFKNPVVDGGAYERIKAAHPQLVAYPQGNGLYKLAAGWLIERAGWKGRRMGPAGVHDRQALVLVNHGGATADDIQSLSEAIRQDVRARFGVVLEQEPVAVG